MYQLRIESGAERGQTIPLPLGGDAPIKLTLGRGADVDLQFADGTMSRTQAELRWEGGAWFLRNISKHGSYVGRKKLAAGRQRKLKPNDALLLGETQVVFALDPNAIATPGQDALTPQTPSIAAPPTLAGYDDQGFFHSGQTLMQMPDDPERSFVVLLRRGPYTEEGGLKVKRRRLYFYALILLLGVVGMVAMAALVFWPTFKKHPADLTLATAFALVPGLLYLPLLKFLDRNGQIPWRNILACMVWGGTVGCGFSLVLNTTGSQYLANFIGSGDAFTTTAILIAPLVEEVIKGMAVLVLFWILHDEFDNVLEGMILGAASGMGFALVENCIYNVRFLESGASTLWVMGAYRMVVNALIGHPIYTAMTGAGLGLQRETPRHDRRRYLFPLLGLGIAIGMHVAWNAAAVYLGRMIGDKTGVMTLVINAALLGGAGLLFFIAAYVFAARRERRVLVAYLAEEVDKGFVDRKELDSFHQALGRLRYELEGLFRYGRQVYRVRRNLRLAQVELAFRKWHLAQGDAAKGEASDRVVHEARNQIRDLRNVLNRLEHKDRSTGRLTPYEDLALGETTHQANPYLAPPPETGPQTGPVRPDQEPPAVDPPLPIDPPPPPVAPPTA